MNTDINSGFDLDHLLEQGLQASVGGLQGPSPAVAQSAYHVFATGGKSMSILSTLAAAVSTKAAAGLATAALVAGGASAAATAATGSPKPAVWGNTVTRAVATCKSSLTTGNHGIGQCVSAVAKQKGAEKRALHTKANHTPESQPAGKSTEVPDGKPNHSEGGPHAAHSPATAGGNGNGHAHP